MTRLDLGAAPAWLTARPIAHRGLHDRAAGRIENSLAAARAAIAGRFAIECDVRLSADETVMVFHDADLGRLCGRDGRVDENSAQALTRIPLLDAADGETIPTLASFLAVVSGRVPLVVEVKSGFDGDLRVVRRTLDGLAGYDGPVAVKSFDPAIVAEVARLAPHLPRGFVGEAVYDHPEWEFLEPTRKHALANLLHLDDTRPHFLSWYQRDLPCAGPYLYRRLAGLPVMSWTVRDRETARRVLAHADQIVFEGFDPEAV